MPKNATGVTIAVPTNAYHSQVLLPRPPRTPGQPIFRYPMRMRSRAMKLTSLFIAILFFYATAQCTAVCIQPEKHLPPCHKQHVSCANSPLTADRAASFASSAPVTVLLPSAFVPVVPIAACAGVRPATDPVRALAASVPNITILRI